MYDYEHPEFPGLFAEQLGKGLVQCWVRDFRDWRRGQQKPFPAPLEETPSAVAAFRGTSAGERWQEDIGVDAAGSARRGGPSTLAALPRTAASASEERVEAGCLF